MFKLFQKQKGQSANKGKEEEEEEEMVSLEPLKHVPQKDNAAAEETGTFVFKLMHFYNPKRLKRHQEAARATYAHYDAGVKIINRNPALLRAYYSIPESKFPRSDQKAMNTNTERALFVFLVALHSAETQFVWDELCQSFQRYADTTGQMTVSPGTGAHLPNGETLENNHALSEAMSLYIYARHTLGGRSFTPKFDEYFRNQPYRFLRNFGGSSAKEEKLDPKRLGLEDVAKEFHMGGSALQTLKTFWDVNKGELELEPRPTAPSSPGVSSSQS